MKTRQKRTRTRLEQELQKEAWVCSRCHAGNLVFRVKCYKCSLVRPEDDDQESSVSDDAPRRTAETEAAADAFLKASKDLGLRGRKKRGGVRHKKKNKKVRKAVFRRSRKSHGGSAARSAFRGPRAAAGGRSAFRKKRSKKKKPKKKVGYAWSVGRRYRNQQKRASNGNGWSLTQLGWVIACFVALPVLKETEEVVSATSGAVQEAIASTSEAFQEVVVEGSHQVRMILAAVGLTVQAVVIWYVASRLLNFWNRYMNGNTAPPDQVKLVSLETDSSVWIVPGSGSHGNHKVRLVGTKASCACRNFLQSGHCNHVDSARNALTCLGVPRSVEGLKPSSEGRPRSASGRSSAVARGRAALSEGAWGVPSAGLGACFQGLVEKAKSMSSSQLALEAPPEIEKTQSQRARTVKESLSLDSSSEHQIALDSSGSKASAAGAASSRPGAGRQAGKDESDLKINFLANKESQEQALVCLRELKASETKEVLMTAYTFDQPDIVEALSRCRVPTRMVVDLEQSRGTRTKLQWQSLQQVARSGVRIRMLSGSSLQESYAGDNRAVNIGKGLKGIQHSKTIMVRGHTRDALVIGSSNWTTSSRSNMEMGVFVTGPAGADVFEGYLRSFEAAWNSGVTFDASAQREDPPRRRVTGKQQARYEEDLP